MKLNKFLLMIVIAASFIIPYLVGSSVVFEELAIVHFPAPSGPVKTLLALVFFGFIAAMLPVLPLLFLNMVPVGIAFAAIKVLKANEQESVWVFIFYHLIFLVTIFFTIKAGRAMIVQMDEERSAKADSL